MKTGQRNWSGDLRFLEAEQPVQEVSDVTVGRAPPESVPKHDGGASAYVCMPVTNTLREDLG